MSHATARTHPPSLLALFSALLLGSFTSSDAQTHQEVPKLFEIDGWVSRTLAQTDGEDPGLARYSVQLHNGALAARAGVERLLLPLPGGAPVVFGKVSGANRQGTDFTWHGRVDSADGRTPKAEIVLTVRDGEVSGGIFGSTGNYDLFPDGHGGHLLQETDLTSKHRCGDHSATAHRHAHADLHPDLHAGDQLSVDELPSTVTPRRGATVTMDVIVLYASSAAGGSITTKITNAIDTTNAAFANSGSNARVNLVHTEEIVYPETGDLDVDLNWLTDNPAVWALREQYSADLVALIVKNNNSCGLAWTMNSVGHWFNSFGYSVTARSCLGGGDITLAHEFGHNLGLQHDPQNSETLPQDASYPWSYGHWVDDLLSGFTTVMSYDTLCTFCPRVPYFSNPDVDYGFFPTGTAQRDSQRTLDEGDGGEGTASVVAGFRKGPGDDDRYEDNNTRATAYDLSTSPDTFLHQLKGEGVQKDDDWYRIHVAPGFLTVEASIYFTHADGDIDLRLVDSLGNPLAMSQSITDNEAITHTVPSSGDYYLQVYFANAGNTYELQWTARPPQPDLIVSEITAAGTFTPGTVQFINAEVKNTGLTASPATSLRYRWSPDDIITQSDTLIDTDSVAALGAGAALTEWTTAFVLDLPAGVYWVGACVDAVANEASTTNQCSRGERIVVGPDLTVIEPSANKTVVAPGEFVSVSATLSNIGGQDSSDFAQVDFRVSPNPTISFQDAAHGVHLYNGIDSGQTLSVGGSVEMPTIPGTYWVGGCAETVSNEVHTDNQCSPGIQVVVHDMLFSDGFESGNLQAWPGTP